MVPAGRLHNTHIIETLDARCLLHWEMKARHAPYEIDSDFDRLQLETITTWLAGTYWSPGVTLQATRKAAQGATLVVGAYLGKAQVGYLRIVSDKTRFAWVSDVYIEESHRGKGLAKAMLAFALDEPEHRDIGMWLLSTRDAHEVYASVGFEPVHVPANWMLRRTGNP